MSISIFCDTNTVTATNTNGTENKLEDQQATKRSKSPFIAFSMSEIAKLEWQEGLVVVSVTGMELGRKWDELDLSAKSTYGLVTEHSKDKFEEMKNDETSDDFLNQNNDVMTKEKMIKKGGKISKSSNVASWKKMHQKNPCLSPKDIQDKVWGAWISRSCLTDGSCTKANSTFKEDKSKKSRIRETRKRPTSAYLLYIQSVRAQVVKNMPQLSNRRELMGELGRRWRELEDSKRSHFIGLAQRRKMEYAMEHKFDDKYRSKEEIKDSRERPGEGTVNSVSHQFIEYNSGKSFLCI